MLLVAAVTQGVAFGFLGPTRVAFTSEIVGRDQLGNAITLSMLSMNGTRVHRSRVRRRARRDRLHRHRRRLRGLGGVLAAVVRALRALPARFGAEGDIDRQPVRRDRRRGPYVAARPHLRRLVLSSFVIIMFGFNYVAFIPALVKGEFDLGDGWVGVIMSASSIGAVAVAVPLAESRRRRRRVEADGRLGPAVRRRASSRSGCRRCSASVCSSSAFIGAGTTGYQSLSNSIALNMTGDTHQGRVQSLMMLSFAGFGIAAAPLGSARRGDRSARRDRA